MPRPAARLVSALSALVLCLAARAAAQAPRPGAFEWELGALLDPRGVAFTADGSLLVVEGDADAVRRIDPGGAPLEAWRPVVDGVPVVAPFGVAVHGEAVYLTDRGNARVVVLDADGTPRRAWGGHGFAAGRLDRPAGIAVAEGRVYVADSGNDRIQVFDTAGRLIRVIGGTGGEPGRFRRPLGVALDDDGAVYVADTGNHRIQKIDADGRVLRAWGERGSFPGLMIAPSAVAVRGDRVLVADGLGHRVQVFDRGGAFAYQWGMHAVVPREGEGRIHYPSGIAIDGAGERVAVAEAFENRVQVFGPLAAGQAPPGGTLPPGLDESAHFGPLLATGGGLLAVWEPPGQAISVFTTAAGDVPILVTRFGEPGRRYGQLARPGALLMSADGRWLDVADGARLQRFRIDIDPAAPVRYDPFAARFAKGWDLAARPGAQAAGPLEPAALARRPDGRLLLVDRRTNRLVECDERLTPVRAFGRVGTDGDGLLGPSDLAIDERTGRILVADAWGRCLVQFAEDGAAMGRWTHEAFRRPAAVAIGPDGSIYVSDAAADRVFRLDRNGVLTAQWGGSGTDHGLFWKPGALRFDQRGRLVVVDYGNHRLQAFDADGEWLVTFGAGRAWTASEQ